MSVTSNCFYIFPVLFASIVTLLCIHYRSPCAQNSWVLGCFCMIYLDAGIYIFCVYVLVSCRVIVVIIYCEIIKVEKCIKTKRGVLII